jgi:Starch-binding associating with outer membrane
MLKTIMIRKISIIILMLATLGSCTKDFKTINVDPNNSPKVPLDYLLGQTQLYIGGSAGDPGYATWRANLIYALPATQMFSSLSTFYAGDKYLYQADLSEAYFIQQYPNSVKGLVDLIAQSQDPVNVNILSIARILKVVQLSIMTDLYGDVPYSEAGLGFLSTNFSPKYDAQKDIYADMLKELSEAGSALDASAYIPAKSDFVYYGVIAKWKHFANSLMLRLAMRMQKVDAASAQTWAKKALDGGVMTSNIETFAIHYANDGGTATINSNSFNLGPLEAPTRNEVFKGSIQWSKTLIDIMKARVDPRISTISTLKNGDITAASQKGLPSGLDAGLLLAATGETGSDNYSRPNPVMYSATDPYILLPYAEVEFLKAEAIERGWYTGVAATEYAAGQAAAISQLAVNTGASTISGAAIAAYQAANPYPSTTLTDKLLQIHTEMFILNASTLNGFEGWANYRRTGLPVLTPVNYPGNATNGIIMRRLIYPHAEQGVNVNYQAAITAQGPDLFTTRMWWDTP